MTLHMNDNGINYDKKNFQEAIDIFQINFEDLPPQRKNILVESTIYTKIIDQDKY